MISLQGKKALITGGTRGIGKEIVTELLNEGCQTLGVGRREGDLATKDGVDAIVGLTKAILGDPDILINCAGVYLNKTLQESSVDDYDYVLNINFKAPWLLCKAFSPYMLQQKWGRIVNFGSIASYHGYMNHSLYNASKHAILGMSRSLFKEFNDENVRVICVATSGVNTDMGVKCLGKQDITTFLDPNEVAKYVIFNLKLNNQMVSTEIQLNRMYIERLEKTM